MNLQERIEIAKRTQTRSNCAGAAFFILGIHPRDEVIDIIPTLDYHKAENPPPLEFIKDMDKITEPIHGVVVLFRYIVMNNLPHHMGVIIERDGQLNIVHRKGDYDLAREVIEEDLKTVEEYYTSLKYIKEYYTPRNK